MAPVQQWVSRAPRRCRRWSVWCWSDRPVARSAQVPGFASTLGCQRTGVHPLSASVRYLGGSMPAFCSGTFLLAATLGIALAILVRPGAGFAYTQEEQQACTP